MSKLYILHGMNTTTGNYPIPPRGFVVTMGLEEIARQACAEYVNPYACDLYVIVLEALKAAKRLSDDAAREQSSHLESEIQRLRRRLDGLRSPVESSQPVPLTLTAPEQEKLATEPLAVIDDASLYLLEELRKEMKRMERIERSLEQLRVEIGRLVENE